MVSVSESEYYKMLENCPDTEYWMMVRITSNVVSLDANIRCYLRYDNNNGDADFYLSQVKEYTDIIHRKVLTLTMYLQYLSNKHII